MPVYGIAQNSVNFESQAMGVQFGPPPYSTQSPGDVIFIEDLIEVSVQDFYWDATTTHFGFCEIIAPISGFGDGHIMALNNINLQFDFTHIGVTNYMVTFEFADLGGFENLQVNGHPVIIEELSLNAPGNPEPGVTLYISTIEIAGGMKSTVRLYGEVNTLLIGGQEFFLDNIKIHTGGGTIFKNCVNFESEPYDSWYGGPPHPHNPGDLIFIENDIPVVLHDFFWDPVSSTFNNCNIDSAIHFGFGSGQIMFVNNINLVFDFTLCGVKRNWVQLEFADFGGMENLEINGHHFYIGELSIAMGNPAPDVSWYISRDWSGGFLKASVLIFGNVSHLVIGGQEFALDNICAYYTQPVGISDQANDNLQPSDCKLCQNYPNPFNPETEIRFQIPNSSHVVLKIFNILGEDIRTLVNAQYGAGTHNIHWNGKDTYGNAVSSGVYIYQLQAGEFSRVKKMNLIR